MEILETPFAAAATAEPQAATQTADVPSFARQFVWLLRKELWTHMQGRRVYVGAAICFVLCLLAGAVRVHDYGQAHELRNGFLQMTVEERQRERWVQTLSLLSPTALFDQIAAELSWTGFLQRERFYEEARTGDEKIGRRLAESREVFYSGTPQRITSAFIFRDNIKPYLVPFQTSWVDSERALATCALPTAMLAAFAALFLALGYSSFLKLDVRL